MKYIITLLKRKFIRSLEQKNLGDENGDRIYFIILLNFYNFFRKITQRFIMYGV